ncbi:MAG: DUF4395 domain-containing protein [Candidatus Nanohaloarchaea archaeon]|nr:DUF4395 domain-containing protein [Candidatus Nanohaloarchaea archaeon]
MVSERLRHNLEVQGHCNLDEEAYDGTANWLRIGPAFCLAGVITGTALGSPLILGALVPFALLGIFLPHTPPGYFYNYVIRRWTGTRPLPENGPPRKFACVVATLGLSATAYVFHAGYTTAGYVLGAAMAVVAGLMTFRHYCIASVIYRAVLGWREDEKSR